MRIGYYPGCSLADHSTSREFGMSVERVSKALGLELVEIDDWCCCGATAAHATNHLLSIALPARNLALAEKAGFKEVLAPCAACSNRLIGADAEMRKDEHLRKEVEGIIEMPYTGGVKVINYLEAVKKYCMDALAANVKRKLDGLKVACYYGCLLVRPPKAVQFDDPENPTSMDDIVKACGAEAVDWGFKTECCGAGFTMSNGKAVVKLVNDILGNAKACGANAIAVACPLCHVNLDLKQAAAESEYGQQYGLPVLYISEIIGLALGLPSEELGVDLHFVDTAALVGQTA
ncbi:MAG: heterodisulfide reductase subunit B [Planctomycetes bacterium]|nr:heterodisulfide reductase subunit B [Planctomycetota bacterium]